MDKKFEDFPYPLDKEGGVYEPLINKEEKQIYTIDEIDEDDRIQPKCFAFTTEIKIAFKYMLKECPKMNL